MFSSQKLMGIARSPFEISDTLSIGSVSTLTVVSHDINLDLSGTDRLLVVFAGASDSGTADILSSATFDGVSGTVQTTDKSAGTAQDASIGMVTWLDSELPTSGTYTLSLTFASSILDNSVFAIVFTNVDQTTPVVSTATNSANNAGSSIAATLTGGTGHYGIIGVCHGDNAGGAAGTSSVATGGHTFLDELSTGENCVSIFTDAVIATSSEAYSCNTTWSGASTQGRTIIAASIQEAS